MTAWLRVPLDWYQSHTASYFPDETPSDIRRTFVPPRLPHSKRNFCGFCGTPLTYWSEEPREEAEYVSVSVGSLFWEDQKALEDLELLPTDADTDDDVDESFGLESSAVVPASSSSNPIHTGFSGFPFSVTHQTGIFGGIPWFEEMIEGSQLGRVAKRRRGMGSSRDNSLKVEWEVSEWHSEGPTEGQVEEVGTDSTHTGTRTSVKRKASS